MLRAHRGYDLRDSICEHGAPLPPPVIAQPAIAFVIAAVYDWFGRFLDQGARAGHAASRGAPRCFGNLLTDERVGPGGLARPCHGLRCAVAFDCSHGRRCCGNRLFIAVDAVVFDLMHSSRCDGIRLYAFFYGLPVFSIVYVIADAAVRAKYSRYVGLGSAGGCGYFDGSADTLYMWICNVYVSSFVILLLYGSTSAGFVSCRCFR